MRNISAIYLPVETGSWGDEYPYLRAQIWQGEGSRRWFEGVYPMSDSQSLCGVRTMVPRGPDDPNQLLDATILFLPDNYRECESFEGVVQEIELGKIDFFDFNLGSEKLPKNWEKLREEARPIFDKLNLYLIPIQSLIDIGPRPAKTY